MKYTHCQSCGAPIDLNEEKCPYCDTPYPHIIEESIKRKRSIKRRKEIEDEIRSIKLGIIEVQDRMKTEQLYQEAIKAMRSYAHINYV